MFNRADFDNDRRKHADAMAKDAGLRRHAFDLTLEAIQRGYLYQWTWLNLPIIQLPTDMLALQEIVWENKPDVIIETGIAWGGSVLFYASLCQLLGKGEVVAVDVKLMDHVKAQIMSYPFSQRIHLYNGSSTDTAIAEKIKSHVKPGSSVMVILDSSHTHDHVLAELKLYAPLVTKGQFLIVCDTFVEDSPPEVIGARPWGRGNNPRTAVATYLETVDRFQEDDYIKGKAVLSLMPNGYLRCAK